MVLMRLFLDAMQGEEQIQGSVLRERVMQPPSKVSSPLLYLSPYIGGLRYEGETYRTPMIKGKSEE